MIDISRRRLTRVVVDVADGPCVTRARSCHTHFPVVRIMCICRVFGVRRLVAAACGRLGAGYRERVTCGFELPWRVG